MGEKALRRTRIGFLAVVLCFLVAFAGTGFSRGAAAESSDGPDAAAVLLLRKRSKAR